MTDAPVIGLGPPMGERGAQKGMEQVERAGRNRSSVARKITSMAQK